MPTLLFSPSAWLQPRTSKLVEVLCHQHGKPLKVKKQTQLLDAGFSAKEIYLLMDGACRYVYYDHNGHTSTMSLVLPGRSIGDLSIFLKKPVIFNLEIIEDCTFQVIPKGLFLDYLEEHPEEKFLIYENINDRFLSYLEGYYSNATLDCAMRFSKLIEALAKEPDNCTEGHFVRLPTFLSQELIAEVLATNRVTINKLLQQWKKEKRLTRRSDGHWVDLRLISHYENPFR